MAPTISNLPATATLVPWLLDARARTLALLADLSDEALVAPKGPTLNPRLWELGHVAWFQERWMLRRGGAPSIRGDADALFDSAAVPHRVRWDLPLPSRREVLDYARRVLEAVVERLAGDGAEAGDAYFAQLVVFHEDMHGENFVMTRQTLGEPAPWIGGGAGPREKAAPADDEAEGDAPFPATAFHLGASEADGFVFDNEKWAHRVEVGPFSIARLATTQGEFAAFVDADGYETRSLWSEAGWEWRTKAAAREPIYWRRGALGWERRDFDRWVALERERAMVHVNAFEAEAYAAFFGRRLPSEAEWEAAASLDRVGGKRRRPWGDGPASAAHANLDGAAGGCADVRGHAAGDSAVGVRQAWGNVWEWTSDPFAPYPGFVLDPYAEYSEPWFHTHRVLRGGCWATRARLLRNTWRNFFTPERRDVFAGLRTAARS